MSEFGKVLEAAGWERQTKQNLNVATYKDFLACEWPWGIGVYLGLTDYWTPEDPCLIRAEDENHVLRIVAAIEGEPGWRSGDPPIDEVVDVMWDTPGLGMIQTQALTRDGRVFKKPHPMNGFTMVCRVKEAVWRPYNPANWEVKKGLLDLAALEDELPLGVQVGGLLVDKEKNNE